MIKWIALITVCCSIGFISCKKDEGIAPVKETVTVAPAQELSIHLAPVYKGQSLQKGQLMYRNAAQDSFMIQKWQFYLSNFVFHTANGGQFKVSESYYLMDAFDETRHTIKLKGLPSGDYVGISFIAGIDSTRNVSGAQTGDLQQTYGMFWSWNQGYIFSKLEGEYKNVQQPQLQNFSHHVGGFLEPYNCIESVSLNFAATPLKVTSSSQNVIDLKADLDLYFNGSNTIDLTTYQSVTGGRNGKNISTNYKSMYAVTLVKN